MKSLFALCLLVNDFDKSFEFYTKKLNLEVNSINGKFADFKLSGTSLAIFEKSEAELMLPKKYMKTSGGNVIAYQTEGLTSYLEGLKQVGVEIIEGPKELPWGQKVAYFLDPDENIWEVSEK